MENEWVEKPAIQELCARYCDRIDSQDADGWAHCFTSDGVSSSTAIWPTRTLRSWCSTW